ncbi:hypothetical protein N9099_01460 [Mariniblastus sp.]|nr:hypothetical protein [Mariniblastus sp.]
MTLNPTGQDNWSKPVREFGKDFTQTGNGTGLLIRFNWLASISIEVFSTHRVERASSKRFG